MSYVNTGQPLAPERQRLVCEAYDRLGSFTAVERETGIRRRTVRRYVRARDRGETQDARRGSIDVDMPPILAELMAEGVRKPASFVPPPVQSEAPVGYTAEAKGNVTIVRIPYESTFEQRFLFTADRHWDNPHSDQSMQRAHLEQAARCGAGVIDIGDLFCAMQGKWDKRASKSCLRPEHQTNDYLDALVQTASGFFAPFARNFIRISPGNHETSILKKHETDLTSRLVENLNRVAGANIHLGGYSGWVHFRFERNDGRVDHRKAWLIHGYGGGGPVTKGVIQTNRQAVYVPDADIVFSGHIHEEWTFPITRTRLDNDGNQYMDEQLHVQIPTYKDEYGVGLGGWHIERGGPPKPIGATWLTFRKEFADSPIEVIVSRAK